MKHNNIQQHMVSCERGNLTYLLERKMVKNINVRIKPEGIVQVSANEKVPIEVIEDFLKQKQDYIFTVLERCKEKRETVCKEPENYVTGETYELLGKTMTLAVEESSREEVFPDGEYLFLKVKNTEDVKHKKALVSKWMKAYQKEIFEEIVREKYELFRPYDVPYPVLKIRRMKTCWGLCRPQKGVITLNSLLLKAPRACIEYVVIHEYVHFIYPNHSTRFWDMVTMMMPNWRECKEILEKVYYANMT